MPIQDGKYISPAWNNESEPAINASELNDLTQTVATHSTDYLRDETLKDDTKSEFGFDSSAVPDDLFSNLNTRIKLIQKETAQMTLTVKTQNGNPLPNIVINGITDEDGNIVKTNTSGVASGYVKDGSRYLQINGYADVDNFTKQYTFTKGSAYTDTWTVTTQNFRTYGSSQSVKFSSNVTRVDVSVGGGGSGAYSYYRTATGADGGAGGYSNSKENVSFSPETYYNITVGAGGAAYGGGGGISSFLGVNASGAPAHNGGGATGNGSGGKGGYANNASNYSPGGAGGAGSGFIYTSFTGQSNGYGGGGGGGGYRNYNIEDVTGGMYGGGGGSPGGGAGNNAPSSPNTVSSAVNGTNGFGGGGGGGGIYRNYSSELRCNCGTGGSGAVAIRMHLAVQ